MSSSRPSAQSSAVAGFGTNEWLVEEMYERYKADPNSVDAAWHEFFADYRTAHAPQRRRRPRQRRPDRNGTPEPVAGRLDAGHLRPAAPSPAGPRPAAPSPPTPSAAPAAPKSADTKAGTRPTTRPPVKAHRVAGPRPRGRSHRCAGRRPRVVANMDASLTSDRHQRARGPAKLLTDNRVVINNHLRRAPRRQGVLHPPHRLRAGQGARRFPVMNNAFAEIDGKPTSSRPEHVNLGLAIDLQKADGRAPWSSRRITAPTRWTSPQFWAAYEDVVRKARTGKLTTEDFRAPRSA